MFVYSWLDLPQKIATFASRRQRTSIKERGRSARKQIKPPLNSVTAAVSNGQTTSHALTEVANKPKQATFLCPSPLHHTFLLGRARFTAQPLSALLYKFYWAAMNKIFIVVARWNPSKGGDRGGLETRVASVIFGSWDKMAHLAIKLSWLD